jgi:hypothetical protein
LILAIILIVTQQAVANDSMMNMNNNITQQQLYIKTWFDWYSDEALPVPLMNMNASGSLPISRTFITAGQISLSVHAIGNAARNYVYMVNANEPDFTVHLQSSKEKEEHNSLHVMRMRMLRQSSLAPVCRAQGNCYTDINTVIVNCVNDGLYNINLMVYDSDSGDTYGVPFQIQCTIKPFPSRQDLGHLGPGLPAVFYFSALLAIWTWNLRKKQFRDAIEHTAQNGNGQSSIVNVEANNVKENAVDAYIWMLIGAGVFLAHGAILLMENEWFQDASNAMHFLVGLWMLASGLLHLLAKKSQRLQLNAVPTAAIIIPISYGVLAALFVMHSQDGVLDAVVHQVFSFSAIIAFILSIMSVTRQTNIAFMLVYFTTFLTNTITFCCSGEWMMNHSRWTWSPVNFCFAIVLFTVAYTAAIFLMATAFAAMSRGLDQASSAHDLPQQKFAKCFFKLKHVWKAMFSNASALQYSQLKNEEKYTIAIDMDAGVELLDDQLHRNKLTTHESMQNVSIR